MQNEDRTHSKVAAWLRQLSAMLLMFWGTALLSQSAHALSCPATQPDASVSASQYGISFYKNAKLYDQAANATNTVLLCRYSAYRYSQSSIGGGAATYQGIYKFDRMVGAAENPDPPLAWVVRLFAVNGGPFVCSGSAISPDWVLTARHCGRWVGQGSLVLGGTNAQSQRCFKIPVWGGGIRTVCTSVPPPAQSTTVYKPAEYLTGGGAWKGDLMLLKLNRPLVLTQYGAPAVSSIDFDAGMGCTLFFCPQRWSGTQYGWSCGVNTTPESCPNGSNAINVYAMSFWRNDDCNSLAETPDPALCAIGGSSTLEMLGDSGGPLVSDDLNLIVGVYTGTSSAPKYSDQAFADLTNIDASTWLWNTAGPILSNVIPPAQ